MQIELHARCGLAAPTRRMPTMLRLRIAAMTSFWLLLAGAALPCRAQPVAVLTDGGGAGRTFTSTGPVRIETLDLLNPGTRVQVDAVAQIVVLYLASGAEFYFTGPGVVEVGSVQLIALSGSPPLMKSPAPGKEIRLRTQRTAQGGVVLRGGSAETVPAAAAAAASGPQSRQPAEDAPLASWVAYALWLDENHAASEAKAVWRRIAAERPEDAALAQRAQ